MATDDRLAREDEKLLREAERTLTQIKVAHGLSDEHASVLAALRLRLKGDPGTSLEDMLAAAGDLGEGKKLEELLADEPGGKGRAGTPSLDDVLARPPKKKASLDDLFSGPSRKDEPGPAPEG
jgi:hypothetical protein